MIARIMKKIEGREIIDHHLKVGVLWRMVGLRNVLG